jgi:small subunit ribosomal protein S2
MFKQELEELGEKQGFHYMNHKIPAWVLTNFDTLLSRIKSLQTMRDFVGSPLFESLTKKEQSMKRRQLAKIEKVYKWVVNLRKRPDLVIIIDGQMMHKFVEEIEILSIPAVVLSSTNFDMYTDCHLVHCNVNNTTSIRYVLEEITS